LLERSGIGRPDVLAAAGLRTVVESPHVGERVIEQCAVSMQVRFRGRVGMTERLNTRPKQLTEGVRYLANRRGPIATSGYDVVSAFRSSLDVERPDVQRVWVPMAVDETSEQMKLAPYSGMLFTGYALRPTTASSVHLRSGDPDGQPVIEQRYLEHHAERAATGSIFDHARQVVSALPLADLVESEVLPGSSVAAPDDDDAVDHQLRVRGVEGLRVIDAEGE
jgi:choline dehydrogenase-like flavoprotein